MMKLAGRGAYWAQQGARLEWHEIAGYRVSFDARLEASRFIIVQDERPAWWRRVLARWIGAPYGPRETVPVIVGRGLIEGHHGPYVLWDEAPADTEVATTVATVMLARWSEMQARLLEQEKGRRPA